MEYLSDYSGDFQVKIKWTQPEDASPGRGAEKGGSVSFTTDSLKVGHRQGEMYISLGEVVVILPPVALKRMAGDLRLNLAEWERLYGTVRRSSTPGRESVPRRVLKELYKSKKVSPKLLAVNTRRRKHIPSKEG